MSLRRATCPIHGLVKVNPETLRHTCGRLCEPVQDAPAATARVDLASYPYGDPDPAPEAPPEAAPEPPPPHNPDWQLARVSTVGLPAGRAAQVWVAACRTLIAASEEEIAERRACMARDAARMTELADLVAAQKRLLERAGVPLEADAPPSPLPVAATTNAGTDRPWSRKFPELTGCRRCGRADRKHAAHGYCHGCLPHHTATTVVIDVTHAAAEQDGGVLVSDGMGGSGPMRRLNLRPAR